MFITDGDGIIEHIDEYNKMIIKLLKMCKRNNVMFVGSSEEKLAKHSTSNYFLKVVVIWLA